LCITVLVVELQVNTFPISESEKFHQLLFSLLYHYFLIQSEYFRRLFLHLLDALNPAVVSILPWQRWLWCYSQNAQNSNVKFSYLEQRIYPNSRPSSPFQLQLESFGQQQPIYLLMMETCSVTASEIMLRVRPRFGLIRRPSGRRTSIAFQF